ncbi:MAG: 4Fe-4S binding protein [Chitinispirillaceae bacterium]|nr:4Fe-4S binding protein [Chitinispirillaceae bacterium]
MNMRVLKIVGLSLFLAAAIFAAKKKFIHVIDQSACTQCGICVKSCPVKAIKVITKDGKTFHEIDPAICIQCGMCIENCPVGAISKIEKIDSTASQTVTDSSKTKKAPSKKSVKKKKSSK